MRYLGTYPRRVATRDELIVAFWPSLEPDVVAHRLHLAASGARAYLRAWLGGYDALASVMGGYAWNANTTIRSDVDEFLTCCKTSASQSLEAAVALYRGEFLAGESADWLQPMRGDFPAAL